MIHEMIGQSPRLLELFALISKAAPTNATVLIEGETGTGKELVTRALHRNSKRAGGPFVAFNCAALTESLLESELFGHERGAFTGAVAARKGKFEQAAGGTLFLDEIGEIAPGFQTKLLRALQERTIERIGAVRPQYVDVRVIAATNRDLEWAVASGEFREDLYFRLKAVSVHVPPLRERPEDILILARHFLSKFAAEIGRRVQGLSDEVASAFQQYAWPGNVRELQQVILSGVVLGSHDVLVLADLPRDLIDGDPDRNQAHSYRSSMRRFKSRLFETALKRAHGDYKAAAALLGVPANGMHRFLRDLRLTYLLKKGPVRDER